MFHCLPNYRLVQVSISLYISPRCSSRRVWAFCDCLSFAGSARQLRGCADIPRLVKSTLCLYGVKLSCPVCGIYGQPLQCLLPAGLIVSPLWASDLRGDCQKTEWRGDRTKSFDGLCRTLWALLRMPLVCNHISTIFKYVKLIFSRDCF